MCSMFQILFHPLKWSRQTLLSSAFTNGRISRAVIKRMNCQEYREQVKGSRPKQLTFLADMSAKAFSLPPGLNRHNEQNDFFFMYTNNIFLHKMPSIISTKTPQKLTFSSPPP